MADFVYVNWQSLFKGLQILDLELLSKNAFVEIDSKIIACGRLQNNGDGIGQIRYMAISEEYQRKGLGKLILERLEDEARNLNLKKIELQWNYAPSRAFQFRLKFQMKTWRI